MEGQLGAALRVLYPGGFDLFHHGHVTALHAAKSFGHLIVGVNSDALMETYKRKPAMSQEQRVRDVQRQGIADEVVIWNGPEDQDQQILDHHPDIYIAGTDWLSKDLAHQLRLPSLGWFDIHHISLLYLRRTTGVSTTQLIRKRQG